MNRSSIEYLMALLDQILVILEMKFVEQEKGVASGGKDPGFRSGER